MDPPEASNNKQNNLIITGTEFRDEGGFGILGCPGSIKVQFCLGYCGLGEKNSFDKEQPLP